MAYRPLYSKQLELLPIQGTWTAGGFLNSSKKFLCFNLNGRICSGQHLFPPIKTVFICGIKFEIWMFVRTLHNIITLSWNQGQSQQIYSAPSCFKNVSSWSHLKFFWKPYPSWWWSGISRAGTKKEESPSCLWLRILFSTYKVVAWQQRFVHLSSHMDIICRDVKSV